MEWHVQYTDGLTDKIRWRPTPEEAIEVACRLIDRGHDVYGVGTGPLTDSIPKIEIARIYAMWVAAKYPVGLMGASDVDYPPD